MSRKDIGKYRVLILFSVLFLVGLGIRFFLGAQHPLWEIWSAIDVSFAVALGVLAFMAYREMVRDDDEIFLYFQVGEMEYNTGLSLLRKDCTRSEILGLLGMMQRKTKERFSFDSSYLPTFLQEVQRVQRGEKDRFVIKMPKDDFDQFDLSIYQGKRGDEP